MGKRFIDPKNAQTFTLVHRSQVDPLIASDAASKMVFRPQPPSKNLLRSRQWDVTQEPIIKSEGYTDSTLDFKDVEWSEELLNELEEEEFEEDADDVDGGVEDVVEKIDNAASYGIYFPDQNDYDYTKHLKAMGEDPGAVFVESKFEKEKIVSSKGIQFLDNDASAALDKVTEKRKVSFQLPQEVLPSTEKMKVGMLNKGESDINFDLHMDSDLKEILAALNDEEYIENDLDEDFFTALDSEQVPEKIKNILEVEDSIDSLNQRLKKRANQFGGIEGANILQEEDDEESDWMKAFKEFRSAQSTTSVQEESENDSVDYKNGGTTKTATTNFSMTSSAMFRNKHLTLLDDQFDRLMMKEYASDEEEYEDEVDEELSKNTIKNSGTISQQRMDKVLDDFLDKTEILGKRAIKKTTFEEQMNMIRHGIEDELTLANEKERIYRIVERDERMPTNDSDIIMPTEKHYDGWDCASIISTYSNIYNRPTIVRATHVQRKIVLGKDGLPVGAMEELRLRQQQQFLQKTVLEEAIEEETADEIRINRGERRPKGETTEEKKLRKEAVLLEKKNRREEKKKLKNAFKEEKQRQSKSQCNTLLQNRTTGL